jgi:hypothetical protein
MIRFFFLSILVALAVLIYRELASRNLGDRARAAAPVAVDHRGPSEPSNKLKAKKARVHDADAVVVAPRTSKNRDKTAPINEQRQENHFQSAPEWLKLSNKK